MPKLNGSRIYIERIMDANGLDRAKFDARRAAEWMEQAKDAAFGCECAVSSVSYFMASTLTFEKAGDADNSTEFLRYVQRGADEMLVGLKVLKGECPALF